MTFNETVSRHTRTATAFFDTLAAAEKTKADLLANGIARSQISLTPEANDARADTGEAWDPLADPHMPGEDRESYAEGIRRGGFLLSVRTDAAQYDRVLEVLDTEGAVEMDRRESDWRLEGWTRGADQVTSMATSGSDVPVASSATDSPDGWKRAPGEVTSMATTSGDVPVYDHDSAVGSGRRDTGHGRSRLRSYMSAPAVPGTLGYGAGADRIAAHMEVLASGGERVGTVDHMEGADTIKLAKTTSPDGQHHYIPLAWVDHVDSHVHLTKSGAEVRSAW